MFSKILILSGLNLVFQFILCFLMATIKHWFPRKFTEADRVSNNTRWVLCSASVLPLFLVQNCLNTLLLAHLQLCFGGKTPAGFQQTKCFEDVDSLLLNWGPIKLSLVLQCQGCAGTPWHSWKSFCRASGQFCAHTFCHSLQGLLNNPPLAQVKCRLPKHPASHLAPFCFSIDSMIQLSSFALSEE